MELIKLSFQVSYKMTMYVHVLSGHSKDDQKLVFNTDYRLMQVKSIAECSNSAILSTFIKVPFVIKIFVWSIFEWPLQTGFTV